MYAEFAAKAGLADGAALPAVVSAVQAIPYGRPPVRTPAGVLDSWRGTCSTKHALLAAILRERWPEVQPRMVHRVYRAGRVSVRSRHGPLAAAAVPAGGLTDVHRYLVITLGGADIVIDVTFPGDPPWDGRAPMSLACGPGQDFQAGSDPDADKAALEARYCDPAVREPFIAALASAARSPGR